MQENSRLESELVETGEKLAEYESLASKLQRNLENVLAEKVKPPLYQHMLPIAQLISSEGNHRSSRLAVVWLKLTVESNMAKQSFHGFEECFVWCLFFFFFTPFIILDISNLQILSRAAHIIES